VKLTKTTVEKLPLPEKGQRFEWDDDLPGFGVRLTPGSRSYIAQHRVDGRTRRVTLGRHGVLTADEARKRARRKIVEMGDGADPVRVRKIEKAQSATLRQVADDYLQDRSELKPSSRADIEKHLNGGLKSWKRLPMVSITRDKVATRFRELSKASPAQANQAFRILRALWNYHRAATTTDDGETVIPDNPAAVLSDLKIWNDIQPRSTRIPTERIGAVWAKLEELRADPGRTAAGRTAADLVAFLLLTGARFSEAAELTADRVDFEKSTWFLPDPKNRNPVTLPLSTAARELLEDRGIEDGYLFPKRSGDGHISDARGTLATISVVAGTKITAHDLRRTFRAIAGGNKLEGNGCSIELWKTKLLMNHKLSGDITISAYTETSNLDYLSGEVEDIATWIAEQARVATSDNVVEIRA
jgi:integrase